MKSKYHTILANNAKRVYLYSAVDDVSTKYNYYTVLYRYCKIEDLIYQLRKNIRNNFHNLHNKKYSNSNLPLKSYSINLQYIKILNHLSKIN